MQNFPIHSSLSKVLNDLHLTNYIIKLFGANNVTLLPCVEVYEGPNGNI